MAGSVGQSRAIAKPGGAISATCVFRTWKTLRAPWIECGAMSIDYGGWKLSAAAPEHAVQEGSE